jgi:hypothetical protein
MKTLFTLFALLVFTISANAQQTTNLIVFSDDGQPFHVIINGIKQNLSAETNVRVTGLQAETHRVKIIFSNSALPVVDATAYCEFGTECTYRIKMNKKGEYKLQPFGEPVALASSTGAGSSSVVYHAAPLPEPSVSGNNQGTVSETQVHTETQHSGSGNTSSGQSSQNGENVNINVNMGGTGFNMNVSVTGTGMTENSEQNTEVSYSETVTSGTSVSSGTTANSNASSNPASKSNSCYYPVSSADFNAVKSSIEGKDFEDTKLSTAKQAIKSKGCFSTAQIKEILGIFDFEDSKLEIAKFSYDYCSDKDNYYQVSEVFDFDASTEELNQFLENK